MIVATEKSYHVTLKRWVPVVVTTVCGVGHLSIFVFYTWRSSKNVSLTCTKCLREYPDQSFVIITGTRMVALSLVYPFYISLASKSELSLTRSRTPSSYARSSSATTLLDGSIKYLAFCRESIFSVLVH